MLAAGLAAGIAAGPPPAAGEPADAVIRLGELEILPVLDAGFGAFAVSNTQNGSGNPGRRNWIEGFVAPGLDLAHPLGDGSLYAGLTAIGSLTRGDGDAQAPSSTARRPEHLGLDRLVLGWRSGERFATLGRDAVDFSAGRQGLVIGDGFLIADGTAEGFRRAAYVTGPRGAFDRTAILKLDTAPVRADLFHLEGQVDQRLMGGNDAAATKLYGANVEWFGGDGDTARSDYDARDWYLGATALRLYDADRGVAAARDGMTVYALRAGGTLLAAIGNGFEDFAFYGEYGIQRNDAAGRRQHARAWYLEPQYTASMLPWSPRLSYRYAHFSGDNDDTDGTDHAWDALYTGGGPRGFGSWDQGEIYGRYAGGNSNLNSHMLHLRLQPLDDLAIGIIHYWHAYDRKPAGVSDAALMREVNLYAEWETPLPGLGISAVLGAAKAGAGRRQELGLAAGADRTTWLGQIVFGYSF